MNNLLTHYPVNWIDGMKLSSSHFIAVQDFVTDSVRDAIALQTPYGEAAAQEYPPRIPFLRPTFLICLILMRC